MGIKIRLDQKPRQFGSIIFTCGDKLMAELLMLEVPREQCLRGICSSYYIRSSEAFLAAVKKFRAHEETYFELCMGSGAKLIPHGEGKNEWRVYGYHYSGQDIVDSLKELLIRENLFEIKKRLKDFDKAIARAQ